MVKIEYADGHFIKNKDGNEIEIDPEKVYRISDFAKIIGVDQQYIRNMEKYVQIVFPKDAASVKYVDQESMKHIALIIQLKEEKNMTYPSIRKEFEDRGYLEHQEQEGKSGSALLNLSIDDIFETLEKKMQDIPKTLGEEFVNHEKKIVDGAEERFAIVVKDENELSQDKIQKALIAVGENFTNTLTDLKGAIEEQNNKAADEKRMLQETLEKRDTDIEEMKDMMKTMMQAQEMSLVKRIFGFKRKEKVKNKEEKIETVDAEIIEVIDEQQEDK